MNSLIRELISLNREMISLNREMISLIRELISQIRQFGILTGLASHTLELECLIV